MITAASNPVDHARGVLQVEAETARYQRDKALDVLELLVAALDGGHQWEIDHAIHRSVLTLNALKEATT